VADKICHLEISALEGKVVVGGCPGIQHREVVIALVDDHLGMILAEDFHDNGSWPSIIYSGICLASEENHGKRR
jgi:hypothetical protein